MTGHVAPMIDTVTIVVGFPLAYAACKLALWLGGRR